MSPTIREMARWTSRGRRTRGLLLDDLGLRYETRMRDARPVSRLVEHFLLAVASYTWFRPPDALTDL